MVLDKGETPKPKRGQLIQDRAFARNRIWENDVKSRKPIGRDEKQGVAQIKDFADFAAAKLFYSGKFE